MRAAAHRGLTSWSGRLRPYELLALGAFVFVLLPGLALTAISPSAWPIPAVAVVGVLLVVAKAVVAPATREVERDPVAIEAATGVTQLETWLSERHHT